MKKRKDMLIVLPNFVTGLRMVGTFLLLFTKAFSPAFYVVYSICGISDVLDGFLARRTGTASEFGARLDSVADLLFYTVLTGSFALGIICDDDKDTSGISGKASGRNLVLGGRNFDTPSCILSCGSSEIQMLCIYTHISEQTHGTVCFYHSVFYETAVFCIILYGCLWDCNDCICGRTGHAYLCKRIRRR